MKTLSILEAVAEFSGMAVEYIAIQQEAMEGATKIVEARAKAIVGHYQNDTGPFDPWRDLADSTIADKERKGYAPPDNPLLRTGDMRESITHDASPTRGIVGSDEDIALWQELGTHGPNPGPDGYHVPPRSFLGAAAFQKQDQVAELIADAAVSVFTGTKRLTSL